MADLLIMENELDIDMVEVYTLTARLVYTNALRVLNDRPSSSEQVLKAVLPIFALQFSRQVIGALGAYRFKVLLSRIKRSPIPLIGTTG